ncbi:unnamed protein product [Angiostrongylus costaricensis]|uniref:Recep_L_domain domain-containing protein n=1 Tax=Angiostrongylus costaricensis TaxID=334426 RepID=A0A158PD34_ANGCS|nr:unnamed protein product [Angiostrongylus costaricensis]
MKKRRCDSTSFSKLIISSLGGIYATSFTIHSCATVFVANDSFAGVVVSDRIEFSNIGKLQRHNLEILQILCKHKDGEERVGEKRKKKKERDMIHSGRLTFEPYAFRNLLQSPKQLVIDKCSLPVVLPNTFTGLSHMEHLWIRNSTIDRLSTNSFYHLTHVNYLYFRDVTIGRIEQRAFGKMYSVDHLFMGGTMQVDLADGWLLAGSSVEEVLLEGVFGEIDEAFILDANVHVVTIRDSILRLQSRDEQTTTTSDTQIQLYTQPQTALQVTNVTMNALLPALLMYFSKITISNCSIKNVRPSRRLAAYPRDVVWKFSHTEIDTVDSYAFANFSVVELSFSYCKLGRIKPVSMGVGGRFHRVLFVATRISSFDESAFAKTHIRSLRISDSEIQQVPSMAFHRSTIDDLKIIDTRIDVLQKHIISESKIRTLSLEKTIVNNIDAKPFAHAEIDEIRIVGCSLIGSPASQLLIRLTPTRLHIINSTFDCDAEDCEMNSMLLNPPRHELLWTFKENSCRTPEILNSQQKTICAKPSTFQQSGLICRLSWAMADCICAEASANLSYIDASVIIVGDCEQLTVAETKPITALYLFRVAQCDVVKTPKTMKTLKVYHSNLVVHKGALTNSYFSLVSLAHTNVRKVAKHGLFNVSVDELVVKNSIMKWDPLATVRSRIQRASITESKIGTVTSWLQIIDNLRITSSVLFSAKGLSTIRNLYLSNNTVLCCCGESTDYCKTDKSMLKKCTFHFGEFVCDASTEKGSTGIPSVLIVISLTFTVISIISI